MTAVAVLIHKMSCLFVMVDRTTSNVDKVKDIIYF